MNQLTWSQTVAANDYAVIRIPHASHLSHTADKASQKPHHAGMHLTCPHCQTQYELDTDIQAMPLLCHRCGHAFPEPSITSRDADQNPTEAIDFMPMERQQSHILPWFMVILTLIAASGFWFQYDVWMGKRWLRSSLINMGFSLETRDKDWLVISASVQPTWIKRPDGSKVLMLKGQVKNLLSSPMLPPRIEIIFFSKVNPDQRLATQLLDVTLPPSNSAIQQADHPKPAIDNNPIAGLTSRSFVFLIDSLPPNSADFSLTARHR